MKLDCIHLINLGLNLYKKSKIIWDLSYIAEVNMLSSNNYYENSDIHDIQKT